MFKIAVLEDQEKDAKILNGFLLKYAEKENLSIQIEMFPGSVDFIEKYTPIYQLVLLDIQMPDIDGMTVAERIRKVDEKVILVFVTNMPQYAVKGYKVNALDFILKPVSFFEFSMMMNRVVQAIRQREDGSLVVTANREARRVLVSQIRYIEVHYHKLFYHLENEILETWGSLAALEKSLPSGLFSLINSGTLVNLRYVCAVKNDMVTLQGEMLPLSRRRKKRFLSELAHYYGEG